jgi:predicted HTH transcriptional regulator
VQDDEYYRFIFKKTEKIISVIFFVSNNIDKEQKDHSLIEDVLDTARLTHNAVLATLDMRAHLAEESLRAAAHKLISLDSKLKVAAVVGLIAPDVLHLLSSEIDGVLRGLNKYLVRTSAFDDLNYRVAAPARENAARPRSVPERGPVGKAEASEGEGQVSSIDNDRRDRIKVVLGAKGEATIKDIADIINDVSSKTIQRELNAMIEDNLVKRHGERRWSKYSLV